MQGRWSGLYRPYTTWGGSDHFRPSYRGLSRAVRAERADVGGRVSLA